MDVHRPDVGLATPHEHAADRDPTQLDALLLPDARPAASFPLRAVLMVVGTASLAVGLIGLVVPVLPSTVFFLVAAACYARASSRLYHWLLALRFVGPVITEWRRSRSLPPGVKTRALVAVAITFAVSIVVVDSLVSRVILVTTGVILALFLARLPTRQA